MRSSLSEAVAVVGDRWSLQVVRALMEGPHRFGELQTALDGIAPNVLSQRLKHLEAERLVVARPYSHRPRRFTYVLTETGHDLAGAIRLLAAWGAGRDGTPASPAHEVCGSELDVRWFCPTCERPVDDPASGTASGTAPGTGGSADGLHYV